MKRYISAILIPCLLLQISGCFSNYVLSKEEFISQEKSNVQLVTQNDETYNLKSKDYTIINDTVMIKMYIVPIDSYGVNKMFAPPSECQQENKIPLSEVKTINVDRFNLLNTMIICGIIGLITVLAITIPPNFGNFRLSDGHY